MRAPLLLLFFLMVMPSHADGPKKWGRGHKSEPGGPWLGIRTTWLEEATAAQLTDVPKGFGLVVESVYSTSPAYTAGLQSLDVIWKFDEQLIANKGQLLALVKLKGSGNEGALTVSRAGKNLVLPVTIGVRPENHKELAAAAVEVMNPPLPGAIMRQINLGKQTGYITENGLTVGLTRKAGGAEYQVVRDGEVINYGNLEGEDAESWPETIDEKTRRKLEALLQSLVNAEEREESQPRMPRIRRVPVPKDLSEK